MSRRLLTISAAWLGVAAATVPGTPFVVGHVTAASEAASAAQASHVDYRVVFSTVSSLESTLNAAGRDGFGCVAVAQSEPGVRVPGVAVVLARTGGASSVAVTHRVIEGGRSDVPMRLERIGTESFRLCGLVLAEASPRTALVAIASRRADQPTAIWHYAGEVLSDYRRSLVVLNAKARDGFLPVASDTVDDDRVPAMRSRIVILERPDAPRPGAELAVRSNSGPDGFARALNEQGKSGYRAELVWKEGNDFVALMSRPIGPAAPTHTFAVETNTLDHLHFERGRYLFDGPYLSDNHIIVSDRTDEASNAVEEDRLPGLSSLGAASERAMESIGLHLSRNGGFVPVAVRLRQDGPGRWALTTVMTKSNR